MTTSPNLTCSRTWQAEAVLDGRLSRADTESFQRHAATCECCAREIRCLDTLRSVGQRLPILTSTPLEQRRLRQSLLRAANELALHPRPSRLKPALAFGAFAAAVALALVVWVLAPHENTPTPVAGAPTFHMETSKGAAWSSLSRQATLRLLLTSGRFELSVDKLRAGQRFILELPDGELEVKGTRFVVEVHDAKTERVRVHEGRVALRLRGQPDLLLEAGDSWPASTATAAAPLVKPPVAALAPKTESASAESAELAESKTAAVRRPDARSKPSPSPAASELEAPPTEPTGAGDAFAQAMSAFTAGDFGKAERLFAAFERAHPADARVEDATYLRAVARARRGDLGAARAIARDYLRRYPNGLRRAEAERLLD